MLRQREETRRRVRGGNGWLATPARWLLTVGALLWFPLVQPVLQALLSAPDAGWFSPRVLLRDLITVLGSEYLFRSLGFLAVYFLVLWLALRWTTQQSIARLSTRWRIGKDPDPELNLTSQSMEWIDELTEPIRRMHEKMVGLAKRADKLSTSAK